MEIDGLICARMGSSRLPGKALRKFDIGFHSLDIIVKKLRASKLCGRIIIATTQNPEDDEIVAWAEHENIAVFRGSENDVLGRIVAAVNFYQCENIIEILGDNPLLPDDLVLKVHGVFATDELDYCASSSIEYKFADPNVSYPIGTRVQMMKRSFLMRIDKEATAPEYREHATSYIYSRPQFGKIKLVTQSRMVPEEEYTFNFAINTKNQFDTANKIFTHLGAHFTTQELLGEWMKGKNED